jgi:adenylate cyclase
VVLAASGWTDAGTRRIEMPLSLLATNACGVGHIVADRDSDGVLRRIRAYHDDPHEGRIWHLSVLAAARYLDMDMSMAEVRPGRIELRSKSGQKRVIPTDAEGYLYIDWALRLNDSTLMQFPFAEFLDRWTRRRNGQPVSSAELMNRLVFVGSIGAGNNIADRGATPLAEDDFLFSLHWNVARSIITGEFIRRAGYGTEALLVLAVGLLGAVVTWRLRVLWAALLLTAVLGAYLWLSVVLFSQARFWMPVVFPTTAALLAHLSLVTYRGVVEQRERHRIRKVFSTLVSPNVVTELLNSPSLELGGSRRIVSVYFADIRGFTQVTDESHARAEAAVREQGLTGMAAEAYLDAQAREILATVNLYLGVVADTVKKHNGTFDKYIGDCARWRSGVRQP